MKRRLVIRISILALIVLAIASLTSALAASNSVPTTRLTDQSQPITANDLKPDVCAGLMLDTVYVCPYATNGHCTATVPNELILGRPDTKHIYGTTNSCCIGVSGTHFHGCTAHN